MVSATVWVLGHWPAANLSWKEGYNEAEIPKLVNSPLATSEYLAETLSGPRVLALYAPHCIHADIQLVNLS